MTFFCLVFLYERRILRRYLLVDFRCNTILSTQANPDISPPLRRIFLKQLLVPCRASPKSSRPSKRRPPPAPPRRSRRSRSPATPLALRSPSPVNRSPGPCPSSTSSSSSSSRSRSRRRRRSSSDSQSSSSPSGSSPSSRCDPVPSSRYWSQSSPRRRQPPDRRDAYRARGGGSRRRAVDMHEDDDTSGHRWVAALHGDEREYDQRRGRGAGAGGAADDISEARRGGAAVDARVTARGKTAGGRRQQQRERGGRDMRDVDEGEGVQRRSAGARRPQRREGGARERRDLDEGEGGQRRAGRHDSVEDGGERDGVADARRRESGRDATGRQPRSTSNNGEREGGVDATWPGAHSSGEGSFKAQPRVGSGGAGADGEDVAMSRDEHCHSPRHRNDSTAGRRRYPPDVGAAPREPRASGSWQPSGSLDGRGQRSGGAAVLDRPKRTPRPRSPPPPPKRARGYSNVPDEPVSRHRGPASHFKRGYSPMPAETVSRHQGPPSPPRRTPPPPRREGNSRGSRWAAAPEALPPPPLPPPPHPAEALRPNGGANSGGPSAQQQFGLSGVLAADTKRNAHGKVVKYSEPADKAVPTEQWRIYTFKDGGAFDKTRMISLLCRLHTDIDVGYHVGHLHCRDTPSALPLALAVRNSTVFKSPGRTALLLGDWSCVPSRLYSDPCREQNCSRSIAALNIEPLGSEFWGRVTWHRRVILGMSPTNDEPKWFNI
jgi:hypothetical protein